MLARAGFKFCFERFLANRLSGSMADWAVDAAGDNAPIRQLDCDFSSHVADILLIEWCRADKRHGVSDSGGFERVAGEVSQRNTWTQQCASQDVLYAQLRIKGAVRLRAVCMFKPPSGGFRGYLSHFFGAHVVAPH